MSKSLENILKKYGDIVSTGTELLEKTTVVFPVSPAIDVSLGGGIPEGSFVSFTGPPGCGKSSTVLQIIANATQPEFYINGQPRKVFYHDVEHRLKKMNMSGISGLDPSLVTHIHSTQQHILSAQDHLDIAETLIKDPDNVGCILVMDSSSALCPADELSADTSGTIRSTQPKILAHWCRKMASPIKVMNATVIFIQHLITNTSGYGEKWLTDGGEKIKYHLDIKLLTKGKPAQWTVNDKDVQIGQVIEWDVIKSANGQSGTTATSYLRFGHGLDAVKEISILCVDFGIISKGGAWFTLEHEGQTIKIQGEEKLNQLLVDKPEIYATLRARLNQMVTG